MGISRLKLVIVLIILGVSSLGSAQDDLRNRTSSWSLKTQFCQIKDAFNYGLVYTGFNIAGGYTLAYESNKDMVKYAPELGIGPNFNKGTGVFLQMRPIDIFYGKKLKKRPLVAGLKALTNYNWQLYPDLQSGHLFWFTSIEIGPQVIYTFPIKNRKARITFYNSILGFSSRPRPTTETYFYALNIPNIYSYHLFVDQPQIVLLVHPL